MVCWFPAPGCLTCCRVAAALLCASAAGLLVVCRLCRGRRSCSYTTHPSLLTNLSSTPFSQGLKYFISLRIMCSLQEQMSPYSISFTSQKGGSAADLQKRLGSATACVHGATTGCELEVWFITWPATGNCFRSDRGAEMVYALRSFGIDGRLKPATA